MSQIMQPLLADVIKKTKKKNPQKTKTKDGIIIPLTNAHGESLAHNMGRRTDEATAKLFPHYNHSHRKSKGNSIYWDNG